MNECAHPRCHYQVRSHELACRPHWQSLPVRLRNRVWKTYRNRETKPELHQKAIVEAMRLWYREIHEADRRPRCHNCRMVTDLYDTTTDAPVCLTCAKGELAGRGTSSGPLECSRCRTSTQILVSVSDGPSVCCNCQIRLVAG